VSFSASLTEAVSGGQPYKFRGKKSATQKIEVFCDTGARQWVAVVTVIDPLCSGTLTFQASLCPDNPTEPPSTGWGLGPATGDLSPAIGTHIFELQNQCLTGIPSECYDIVASYNDGTVHYFDSSATFAAGDYIVEYIDGATAYQGGDGSGHPSPDPYPIPALRVNAVQNGTTTGTGYQIVANDPSIVGGDGYVDNVSDVAAGVGSVQDFIADAPGTSSQFQTQAEVESASNGDSVSFTLTSPSKIGSVLQDLLINPSNRDNWIETGGSAPRFRLYKC
jgi:hypothetical protein